jgi:hypothetical protein
MRDKRTGSDRIAAIDTEQAEATAVQILVWLTGQPDLFGRFLALTGIEAVAIRQAAAEPGFLAGVTGFVMAHEPTLLAFCEASGLQAELVAACHRQLAGPESENWP